MFRVTPESRLREVVRSRDLTRFQYRQVAMLYGIPVWEINQMLSDGGSTAYYQLPVGAKDLQDLIEFKAMSFSRGNIFKACYRLGEKDDASVEYDLKKIIWYAERELRRIQEADAELPDSE